jgi:hypothetical protein
MESDFGLRSVQHNNGCGYISLLRPWTRSDGIDRGVHVGIDSLDDGSLKTTRIA